MSAVPDSPPRAAPSRHRIRRLLAIVGIGLVVLLVAGLLFLHTSPARRFVLSQVTDVLQQQHIEFNTDELRYNLLDLRLSLRNLRIRAQDAPELPPFASIDRVSLDLSLTQLLRGRYVLQTGEAEGVRVHYHVAADGRDNLPRPPSDPNQPSEPLDYLIEQLRVRNAEVRYENVPQRIDVTLPISTMAVEGDAMTDRHAITLEAADGKLAIQDRKVTLDTLAGEVDLGDDDARIERLEVVAEGARLNVTGTIAQFADPQGELTMRGTLDASRASAIAGLADPVGGTFEIDATATGRLATPMVAGRVNGTDITFRDLRGLQLAATAEYDTAAQRATLSDLQVRAPFGQVSANGAIAPAGSETSRVNATVSSLDAAPLMRAFELPYIVASRVDAQVEASWPGMDYLKASGNATASLTPAAARPSRSVIPVGGRINVTGTADAIDADLTNITTPGVALNGRVRVVNQRDLTGTARVEIADVGRAASTAEVVMGRRAGELLPTPVAGAVRGTAQIGGTIQAPTVAADIQAPSLSVGTASDLSLDTSVLYTPELVTVRDLDLQWQTARARASGTIGLTGAGRLDLTFTADELQVAELLKAADQGGVPASGIIGVQGRVSGTTTAPVGDVTLQARSLVAYNEQWGALTARVGLANRQATVTEFVLDKPQPEGNGRIAGSGSYHLDRRTYTADVQSDRVQLLTLTLPDGRAVRGTLELSARGTGSVDQPAGTFNLTADGLQVDSYEIGRIVADAVLANRQATVNASIPTYRVTANAVVGTDSPYDATAKVRIDDLQLETLPVQLETPLDGRLRAAVEAAGPLATPEAMQGTATIEAFAGTWNGQPFSVDAPAHVRYARERVTIDQLRLVAQDSTVAITGELPITEQGAPGAVNIDARANLATLAQYAPAGANVTASGELTLSGIVRGTLQAIDPELTLVVANGTVVTPAVQPGLTDINIRTRVAGGEAVIEELTASYGDARINGEGRIPFEVLPDLPVQIPRRGGPATLTAKVEGLDLAQLPGAPQGLTGRVSVEAQMAALRADLAALEGRITFPELQVAFNGLTLAQQQMSAVSIGGSAAEIETFTLEGSVGTISATGRVGLVGERPLDVDAEGKLNVAAISIFTDAVRAEGDTTLKIEARGTVANPELDGFVDLSDATFVVDEPTIAAEGVNARVELSGQRVTIAQLTGTLNGGSLGGSGHVEFGDGGIVDVALELTTDDVAFDAPLDLRSMSDATVRLVRRGEQFVVEGQVTLDEGGLTGDINFDEGLLAAMNQRRSLDLTEQRNPFLERVRFNLNIDTATPLIVDNNLAHAEVTADLRLIGTPYEPGLSGRLAVLEEGEITLNERRYEVERGVITFVGERRIQPSFDLLLNTTASNYDITIAVTGLPGETETSLTSDPALPEPDIMSLLVTGRTLEEMRGEEFEVAREQVLSLLAGRVGSQLGRSLQRATGLSTVRIEPNLIANEADPSARLTLGQQLTTDLELIYSTNLTDSNDQIWVAEYDVTRRFQTRAVRQSDNSYRFDLRHDVRIGGRPAPRRQQRQRPVVASVRVNGDGTIPDAELQQMFDVEVGKEYNFFDVRDSIEEIEDELSERGRLESRVRLTREGDERAVALVLQVTAGPQVTFVFDGATPPGGVVDEVRRQWRRGVFDTQRLDDSTEALRGWLMEDNYLQPSVQGAVEDLGPDDRRVRFSIEPGRRFSQVVLAFEGAKGISPDELDDIISEQDLELQLFTDPFQVTELLQRYYREQGYLVATIDEPRYEFEGSQARVVLDVTEGPRFIVRSLTTAGNTVVPSELLQVQVPFGPGDPFLLFAAENALQRIRDFYWRRGYNDARADYELALDREQGRVDVRFDITEGPRTVIADIDVQGNEQTSDRLVREQLELTLNQPLDLTALARSRRNLYDTRAFSIVDITREEVESGTASAAPAGEPAPQSGQPADPLDAEEPQSGERPVRLTVSVREVQPVQLRYGASYDTERGIGGIFDVSAHNLLGKARVIGLRSRYDAQLREVRGYINQPSLRYWPIQTIGNVYLTEQRYAETDLTGRFNVTRKGASIQQERELGNSYVWNYGFRYERIHNFDPRPGGILDERMTVTPLTSTFTRETRDEVLDATRGSFSSHALSYSPSWLGSDQAFMKYFGQYFHYFPLQPERRERFTGEILRPRLVFATGVRVGLGRGFGGAVPLSERFFAGGSTTLRGFEQNAAGPIGADTLPTGGAALFVINNELRFPLVSIFDGVAFSDVGNVFPRVGDFSFSDFRKTAGVGLRVRTPWFLVRGDYGILLDRRAGEPRGRFYFSLGQAF